MTWTGDRRLSTYTHNGTTYTFTYDGDGRRKTKSYGQTRHTYDYVEGRLVRERRYVNNALTMEVQYLYDSTGILGFVYNGMEFYYRKNVQGDVIGVMYGRYQMATYAYDAYGNCTIVNELQNVGKLNPFRFKGYYYDDETGLYYLMTRYYDPEIGRFVNADQIAYFEPESLNGCNLYSYCMNNPVMSYDPTGQGLLLIFSILAIGFIAGGVIGGLTGASNEKEGWELVGDIALGAAMGLAAAGLFVATTGVIAGAASAIFSTASTAFFGVGVKTVFAIGALAYNIVAVGVAPLIGLSMEVLEIGQKPEEPPKSHIPGITDIVSSTGESKVLSSARKAITLLKEKFRE